MENQTLNKWMVAATTRQQKKLAQLSGVPVGYLWNIAHGYRTPKIALIAKIEEITKIICEETGGKLLPVLRIDISVTCSVCPYAIKDSKNAK